MILPFILISLVLQSSVINSSILHKIKTFLSGGKGGQPKTWEFVPPSEIEYPGNNLHKIAIIQEMWNNYYKCLSSHHEDLGPYKSIMPEVLMAYEGTSVKLKCKVCVPPNDLTRTDDIQWNYRTIPPTDTRPVELGEHKFLSPEDKVLHMYDLTLEDTGQYFCQKGQTVTAAYFLEVVNSSEPTQEVHPEESPRGPHPQPLQVVPHAGIQIATVWTKWSKCSTCGVVGKRIRYGICTVQQLKQNTKNESNYINQQRNLTYKSINNNNTNTTVNSSANKDSQDGINYHINSSVPSALSNSPSPIVEHPIFNLFINGIPCRSKMLPKYLFKVLEVQERKSEIATGLCKEPCSEAMIFQVVDEKGNVLETANNSAGIYSTLQGIPPEPLEVQRQTVFEDTLTRRIVLRCPGNLNSDAPIQWQIGSFNIDSATVYIMSHGRIFINILDQIIIKQPQVTDSNIYSCWQNAELAGTIRLIVTKKLELNFNHHIMMLSMIMVLGTFVIVFFRAFRARNRQTA